MVHHLAAAWSNIAWSKVEDALYYVTKHFGLTAIVGLGVGLFQYRKAQQWKRSEFVAQAIKDLESSERYRCAMKMLDFPRSTIACGGGVNIEFDDDVLTDAIPHESLKPYWTKEQEEIRLAFCEFLDGLERLDAFVRSRLISVALLRPYLIYWFRQLTTTEYKSADFRATIWNFIDGYEYQGVRRLAERLARGRRVRLRSPVGQRGRSRGVQWPMVVVQSRVETPPKPSTARADATVRIARKSLEKIGIQLNGGDLLTAVRLLQEGVASRPDDAELHYVLATALVQVGNTEAASTEFGKACRLDARLKRPPIRALTDTPD